MLDTETPALKGLTIQGALLSVPDKDVGITAGHVMVKGGQLQIGSAVVPHTGRATITLTGTTAAEQPETTGFGAKVLGLMGGRLELHGAPTLTAWTKLAADTAVGARSVTLAEAPGWQAGDQIVIATSSLDQAEHDVATVQSIAGNTLTLEQPLRYAHLGGVRTVGGVTVDVRAEVGRLTRNLVIQGDEPSTSLKLGGHAMFMAGNGETSVQIANTEFRRMGQLNQLGRYPLHFHLMAAACKTCYVKDSSVRDTIQRGMVVHGTTGVLLSGNVVFNTVGHNIFIEDAQTTGNTLDRNLALVNRQPSPLHTEPMLVTQNDRMPANFWLKSGRNTLTRNAAAGSFANGFIYDGIEADGPLDFRNNTAHAAMAQEGLGEGDFDTKAGVMIIGGGHPQDRVQDTLVYHNAFGLWAEEGGPYVFERFVAAENRTAVENRGVSSDVTYRQGVFVASFPGGLRNVGNGIHFQYGSDVRLTAPTFANYSDNAFSASDIAQPPHVGLWLSGASFIGTKPVLVPAGDGVSTFEDDSFLPRGTYTADPRYTLLSCPQVTLSYPDGRGGLEGETYYRCAQRYGFAELDVRTGAAPAVRTHEAADILRSDGLSLRGGMFGYPALYGAGVGYTLTTASASGYSVRLHTTSLDGRVTPVDSEQALLDVAVTVLAPPSAVYRTTSTLEQPGAPREANRLRAVSSLPELSAAPLASYFYDATNRRVHVKASVRWVTLVP